MGPLDMALSNVGMKPNNTSRLERTPQCVMSVPPSWPRLPSRAAYIVLNNAKRRNALSTETLQGLRRQLIEHNTSRQSGRLTLLPPFEESLLDDLEGALRAPHSALADDYGWLVSRQQWEAERKDLPHVLVLRAEGPVFSSGHDLGEIRDVSAQGIRDLFDLCAQVMTLIRRSPIPVVGAIRGLATAAGCQLALNTDIPVAQASTQFRLPGTATGFPCSSPVTAVSRRFGDAFGYRLLSLAETYRADQLPGGGVEVVPDDEDYEKRLAEIVSRFAEQTPPRPQALAKWAYWTQAGMQTDASGGDGMVKAALWSGRVMALHLQTEEGKDSMESFFNRKKAKL